MISERAGCWLLMVWAWQVARRVLAKQARLKKINRETSSYFERTSTAFRPALVAV